MESATYHNNNDYYYYYYYDDDDDDDDYYSHGPQTRPVIHYCDPMSADLTQGTLRQSNIREVYGGFRKKGTPI